MQQQLRVFRVRQRLIKAATNQDLVFYSEFINNPFYCVARGEGQPHKIGDVLGEICSTEQNAGRPLLGAICVLKASGMPSKGFWGFLRTNGPDRQKWEKERDRVFAYWKTH